MIISAINGTVPFSRALTKSEEKDFIKVKEQAKKELNTDLTTATIFDFCFPKSKHDTGIGTSFSNDAQNMAAFFKTMCAINSIQLQPQGQISNYIRSPYSGTSFSLGMHLIDLNKLEKDEYGNILKKEDFNNDFMHKKLDKSIVDYDNIFDEKGQKYMLKKAYDNFHKLDNTSKLKVEFKKFKEDNKYWLEKDALYEACAIVNKSEDMQKWNLRDKNIFATKEGDKERISELKKVKDENGRNVVDFEEFVQFIADKQQKESKKAFNKQEIEIFGDCLIGFSQKDVWAHRSAFDEKAEFGCAIGNNKFSCWSKAIDFNKLDGDAGELLKNKFDLYFKRYDGVRIDAAWQLVKPLLVNPLYDEKGNEVFDEKGNKLGYPISNQPYLGDKIINGIIIPAAKANNVKPDRIFLEMLGGNAYQSLSAVKNTGAKLIHITKYAGDNWGRVNFYEAEGNNEYQNMKPGDYTIGAGTHDDESLLSQFNNHNKDTRAYYLSQALNLDNEELTKLKSKWADAAFSELFTTKNQFITLPDLVGSERRINEPDSQNDNWSFRAPNHYKQSFFDNLSNGKGLNLPDALSKALKAKGKKSELTDKLDFYADILRE